MPSSAGTPTSPKILLHCSRSPGLPNPAAMLRAVLGHPRCCSFPKPSSASSEGPGGTLGMGPALGVVGMGPGGPRSAQGLPLLPGGSAGLRIASGSAPGAEWALPGSEE